MGMSYLFMALGASEIPAIELVALRCGLAFGFSINFLSPFERNIFLEIDGL